ncbi:hypothetical protein BKP37_13590 [Anaerobacillus alkalilacustris]|uniref:DUF4825 domain-containing protein n=1 Tax=Anaerobacillus alkalilacustris TaxID=393763 RepID=A0A1S2LJC6_9BACI|nr:hypothetical protein [Anaerobacillus alkalilacustris]OIJ12466.1 hypothetical protein BKP37_13590 [Anaerobacillus alkalilacustris]
MKNSCLFLFLFSFFLFACGTGDTFHIEKNEKLNSNEIVQEVVEGEFILRVVSKKSSYKPYEQENIYAMLKYIGDNLKNEISHAASPFWFEITEKSRDVTIQPTQPLPLIYNTLKSGEWFKESFIKTGAHTEDSFVRDYFSNVVFPEVD